MTLSETIDSFTSAKQETLKTSLRNEMGCHEPDCNLALQIAAGSLAVTSILTIPDSAPTSGVNASTLVASVEAAATQLVAQPPAALSASLGVPVESTAPVAVQTGVVVPLVVSNGLSTGPGAGLSSEPSDSGFNMTEVALLAVLGALGLVIILFAAWKLGYCGGGSPQTPTIAMRRFSRSGGVKNATSTAPTDAAGVSVAGLGTAMVSASADCEA